MFGNGVRMFTAAVFTTSVKIKVPLQTPYMMEMARTVWVAAARGTTAPPIVELLVVSTTHPTSATTALVFVLSGLINF